MLKAQTDILKFNVGGHNVLLNEPQCIFGMATMPLPLLLGYSIHGNSPWFFCGNCFSTNLTSFRVGKLPGVRGECVVCLKQKGEKRKHRFWKTEVNIGVLSVDLAAVSIFSGMGLCMLR